MDKELFEIAKEVSSYWKHNCTDDDFYKNCIWDIVNRLGDNCTYEEVNEVWEIIEKHYLKDGMEEYGFKHSCIIKMEGDYQQEHLPFNDFRTNTYYSVIDNQFVGHKIAQEICENYKDFIIRDDGEYNIELIKEFIYDMCLNEVCIKIQNHVEEYLNNYLELD